jgi:peptidoglycan/xylan/chitin deacetylase (PgdA/CDA1 family)
MLKTLIALTGQKVIFPFYHIVSDDAPIHIKNLYRAKSQKEFIEDLDFLLQYYEPMDLSDVKSFLNQDKNRTKPGFYLSFDDGLSEMYHVVRPILLRKGIPAAFFCNTGFIDNKDMFFRYKISILIEQINKLQESAVNNLKVLLQTRDIKSHLLSFKYGDIYTINGLANILNVRFDDYLNENHPYMTTAQLAEMKNDGFDIGAHSIDHPYFADIDEKEQIRQTSVSLDEIQELTHSQDRIFAFPFTEYGVSSFFFKSVSADIIFGTAGIKKDIDSRVLHRIPMEESRKTAPQIIYKQYIYFMAKAFFNKNMRKR